MASVTKGKSPFYPGQPVPIELFVGRTAQIERMMTRGAGQVALGKSVAMFVQGEYGIGKSSIANYVMSRSEQEYDLFGIYVPIGSVDTIDGIGQAILEATIRASALDPKRSEAIRNWLAKYVGEQSLFGFFSLRFDQLKKDGPSVAEGILPFLNDTLNRLKATGIKGIVLVLDEINGITSNPQFAHFIKGMVDTNALSNDPVPLFLLLCGVEEKRREMIQAHQPADRIFDVIQIDAMTEEEMREFFTRAFGSVQMKIDATALALLVHYSAGFPKIMHLVGDEAYWIDQDGVVALDDATAAVLAAAEDVGRKYVEQQVYRALRSEDYQSILAKIAKLGPDVMTFRKADVAKGLTETEKKKFNNFLQKMKDLKVLRSGGIRGEYEFTMRMVRLYIWLQSLQRQKTGT
jgi:hypothetical protein